MKVVIFKFNKFGDNVVFVPAVQVLRRLEPTWKITLLTTPNEAELYRGAEAPQEILTSPAATFNRSYRRPWALLRWLLTVRRQRPDACFISFDQGTVAHWLAKSSGAPIRVGSELAHLRVRGSVTQPVPLPPDHRPETWHWEMTRALLRALGSKAVLPELPPPPDFSELGSTPSSPPTRPFVLVHAGASKPLNQWGTERFAAVARKLAADHDVGWVEHGDTIGSAPAGTLPLRPRAAGDLASLLRGCTLFLGNNSGPMHLANALGCRGVVVTGPSAPGWDPYWHAQRWTVLRHPNLACAPCERLRETPRGCANLEHPMACFDYWRPEKVEAACRERLMVPNL